MNKPVSNKDIKPHPISLIIGILFISVAGFIYYQNYQFDTYGQSIQALVIEKDVNNLGDNKHTDWVLEFTLSNGEKTQQEYRSGGNVFIPDAQVGDRVEILYIPDTNPPKIQYATTAGKWTLPILFFILGALILKYARKIAELSQTAKSKKAKARQRFKD